MTQVTPTDSMMCISSNWVCWRSFLSSAPRGSSSSSNCGFFAKLRARATRCCCPPDSWCGLRLANSASCTSLSISSTRASICPRGMPSRLRPNAMLSHTLRCGNSAYDWNIMLMGRSYGGNCAMSTPSRITAPDVGFSKPASMRSNVDLPHPELPSKAKISPLRMDSDTSSTATTGCALSNRLTSCRVWRKPSLAKPSPEKPSPAKPSSLAPVTLDATPSIRAYLTFFSCVNTVLIDCRPALVKPAGATIFLRLSASRYTVLSFAMSGLTLATLALLAVG